MDNESDFDFNALTRDQLEHAIETIDGSRTPKNLADARAALNTRISGKSPEPAQHEDEEGDARFVNLIGKIFALLLVACAITGLTIDDLLIPYWSRYGIRVIHLHGLAAWIGAAAVGVFALVPFLGGITDTNGLAIKARFKYVLAVAVVLLLVAGSLA